MKIINKMTQKGVAPMESVSCQQSAPYVEGGGGRIVAFDSLRGIASFVVLFHHISLFLAFPKNSLGFWVVHFLPVKLLCAGHMAVLLFFVLSGFALSTMLQPGMRYSVYVVRRFFRIVAPLAIALLFSAGLYFSIQPVRLPGLSDWANDMIWNQPVTAVAFFRHVFMFGLSGDTFMDSVIWSLVYEMRISLLFPVLYFLCRKSPLTVTGVACVVCVLMQAVMKSHHMALYVGEGLWQSLVLTLYYVPFFLLGICVYHYRMWIKQTVSKLNRWQITVFSLLVLALALDKHDVLIALSGVGPMALAWSRAGVCQFLSHKLFVFMGRISYSLYLVHMLVMASLMQTLYGRASPLFMALAMLMLSPLVAYIFYVCVERPFLTLGRQCSVFVEQQCERVTS